MNLIHKDFLIALANGREVEFKYRGSWEPIENSNCLGIFGNEAFEFRIKPVTISYEIPMPFVPQVGEIYWVSNAGEDGGYQAIKNQLRKLDMLLIPYGVFRTEAEIKQFLESRKAAVAKLLEGVK